MQTFFGSSAFFPPGSSAAWTSSAYWLFPPSLSPKPSQWLSLFSLLAPLSSSKTSLLSPFAFCSSVFPHPSLLPPSPLLSIISCNKPFCLSFSPFLPLLPLSRLPLLSSFHPTPPSSPPSLNRFACCFSPRARTHTLTQHHPSSVSQFVNELSAHQWFFFFVRTLLYLNGRSMQAVLL